IRSLVANDWTILGADEPARQADAAALAFDLKPVDDEKPAERKTRHADEIVFYPAAWHGTLLPATDADTWLAAAFSDYEKIVSLENTIRKETRGKPLKQSQRDEIELARFAPWSQWLCAERRLGYDLALADVQADWRSETWYTIAASKGVMLLAALREHFGKETFDAAMDTFGRQHAGKKVTTDEFIAHCEAQSGRSLTKFFAPWITTNAPDEQRSGNFWSIASFDPERDRALIVYGTLHDVHAQREAAERLQRQIARLWSNVNVHIVKDYDVTDDQLRSRHILLVGRPATNSVAARWADKLPIKFGDASFEFRGQTYAHPDTAVIAAGENPMSGRYSVVVYAGLSADATWQVVNRLPKRDDPSPQTLLHPAGHPSRHLGAARFEVPEKE
ncbi:MAG TPA: hypothetical protein VHV77_10560, partial [Pirellulales bacterium]|nr:hypothetical protein [Pirellulales bacterium]